MSKDSVTYGYAPTPRHPLHVPPKPWHIVRLGYLTNLPVSNDLNNVLIVVGHLTQMAHSCRVERA
jgi:hypothetical protein